MPLFVISPINRISPDAKHAGQKRCKTMTSRSSTSQGNKISWQTPYPADQTSNSMPCFKSSLTPEWPKKSKQQPPRTLNSNPSSTPCKDSRWKRHPLHLSWLVTRWERMVYFDMTRRESAFPKDPFEHRSSMTTMTHRLQDIKALSAPMSPSTGYSTGPE